MPIIDTTKYDRVLEVIRNNPREVNYKIEYDIVVDGDIYKPNAVVEINQERNFVTDYAQSTTVFLRMSQQLFNQIVYPNRNKLRLIRRKVAIGEISEEELPSSTVQAKTFVASLVDSSNPSMQGQVSVDNDQMMRDYLFSVRELAVDELRLTQAGGTFRENSALDIAVGLLTHFTNQLNLPKEDMVTGVTFEPSDVKDVPFQTSIPHEVKLLGIVDWLQENAGGIYNQAAGLFFDTTAWYIYPLFNTTRFEKSKYTAEIVCLSPTQAPSMERTFTIKDSRLFIAATGDVKQSDPEDIGYLNQGNGVRFIKATALHDGPVVVSKNKAKTNLNEVTASISVKDRESGLQSAPFSKSKVTDNVANEISKIAARSGQILYIQWENSDPDLIIPGMPCRVLTQGVGDDIELYGTILWVQSHTRLNQPGMTSGRYKTSSVLMIFANPRK